MGWEIELQHVLRRLDQMIRDIDEINEMYRKEIAEIKDFITKTKEKHNASNIATSENSTDKPVHEGFNMPSGGHSGHPNFIPLICRAIHFSSHVDDTKEKQPDE